MLKFYPQKTSQRNRILIIPTERATKAKEGCLGISYRDHGKIKFCVSVGPLSHPVMKLGS